MPINFIVDRIACFIENHIYNLDVNIRLEVVERLIKWLEDYQDRQK